MLLDIYSPPETVVSSELPLLSRTVTFVPAGTVGFGTQSPLAVLQSVTPEPLTITVYGEAPPDHVYLEWFAENVVIGLLVTAA
jgi:hypothetical protein